jgi:hypothetical protein
MKTRLADKPRILGWMSPANKKFRKDFSKFIGLLPEYSFLDDESFTIEGYYVGENVGSIVLKVKDKYGTYVVKSTPVAKKLITEVAFLNQWRKVGGNALKVLDLIKPRKGFPYAMAILEYVSTGTTEAELDEGKGNWESVYRKFGKGLALIHRAKGKGFGEIVDLKKFRGKYSTFRGHIQAMLTPQRLKTLVTNKLVDKKDLPLISKAIR